MNNNRGNNRRRGRGNNNTNNNIGRPQNGGQQINRIDSRARGNAPQMLEKYRKLAQDAHLNGDRVQAEYYLQFADHYFRVTADTRVRQEEQRLRQNGGQPYAPGFAAPAGGSVSGDRWQDQDGEDESEFGPDSDFPTFDRAPAPQQPRRDEREPREAPREQQRDYREQREPREPREQQRPRAPEPVSAEVVPPEGLRVAEGEPIAPTADNPFVRPPRGRNERRGGRRNDGDAPRPQRNFVETPVTAAEPAPLFDPSSLPPAIGTRSESVTAAPVRAERIRTVVPAPALIPDAAPVEIAEAPAVVPKKRGRPRKNPLPEVQPVSEG